MNNLFESLSMNVSEECFNDIMDIVEQLLEEGIGKEVQEKGKEAAIKNLIKGKNQAFVDAYQNKVKTRRLYRQAMEKAGKGQVPYDTFYALGDQNEEAKKQYQKAFNNNLKYNYGTKGTQGKMVLPKFEQTPHGRMAIVGLEKNGKKYTPKEA